MPSTLHSGARDFDFLHGKWRVKHRTLRGRLTGATEWDEASAIDIVRPAFGGLGNIGHFARLVDGEPYVGMPIRLFNRRDGLWRIYWLDTHSQRMEPPVIGRFAKEQGLFIGDDILRGVPIKVKFVWSRIREDVPCWEQSFSNDDGRSWELNSIMEFTRDSSLPDTPEFPLPI